MEIEIENKRTGVRHRVNTNPEKVSIDDQDIQLDSVEDSTDSFHILWRGKSFRAEIIRIDKEDKQVWLRVNNRMMHFQGRSKVNVLLEKMGLGNGSAAKSKEMKAPMPGLIVKILVTPGAEVKKGDPLIILEAMKMENILKSPNDGIVRALHAEAKQTVDKNQILISFE